MKVIFTDGQATVDALDLGPLLDVPPAQVPALMREGEITSQFATGVGEDAGRFRLTFYYNQKRLRLTCLDDGTVLSSSTTPVGKRL